MSSVTGPRKPALMLLCWVSAWLSVHTVPIREPTKCEVQQILKNLDNLSTQLLQNYRKNESDMPPSQAGVIKKYPLPCFTPGPDASHNISVIQAYLKETPQPDAMVLEELDKLKHDITPEPRVAAPAPSASVYDRKSFVLAVLQQLSACVTATRGAFASSLGAEGGGC